jgi:hypothetical protein
VVDPEHRAAVLAAAAKLAQEPEEPEETPGLAEVQNEAETADASDDAGDGQDDLSGDVAAPESDAVAAEPAAPQSSNDSEVTQWLIRHGLGHLAAQFEATGYDGLDICEVRVPRLDRISPVTL